MPFLTLINTNVLLKCEKMQCFQPWSYRWKGGVKCPKPDLPFSFSQFLKLSLIQNRPHSGAINRKRSNDADQAIIPPCFQPTSNALQRNVCALSTSFTQTILLYVYGTLPLPPPGVSKSFQRATTCSVDHTAGLEKSNVAKENVRERKPLKNHILLVFFFPTFEGILSCDEEGKPYLAQNIDQLRKGFKLSLHGIFRIESVCLVYCFTSPVFKVPFVHLIFPNLHSICISKTQSTVTDIRKFSLCFVKTYCTEINKTV